jgi:hypothetical protein
MWLCPSIRNYYHTSISKGVVVKFRFKPDDFSSYEYPANERPCDAFARCANELLDKAIAEAPWVYANMQNEIPTNMLVFSCADHTHKAVLFNIEELAKKDCKHEPSYTLSGITQAGHSSILTNVAAKIVCSKCGITLKARWEAAE